jgi:hypothetical protein
LGFFFINITVQGISLFLVRYHPSSQEKCTLTTTHSPPS